MVEILTALWAVLSFFLGIVWSVIWFVLSDLLSTVLWIVILIWLGFAARYRSFRTGTFVLLRYGRYGLQYLWRWLRGRPADAGPFPMRVEERVSIKYKDRIPLGYVSLSEQMNFAIVALISLLAFG